MQKPVLCVKVDGAGVIAKNISENQEYFMIKKWSVSLFSVTTKSQTLTFHFLTICSVVSI